MRGLHGRDEHLMFALLCLGLVALIATFYVLHAVIFYDDWRCAFAECRLTP